VTIVNGTQENANDLHLVFSSKFEITNPDGSTRVLINPIEISDVKMESARFFVLGAGQANSIDVGAFEEVPPGFDAILTFTARQVFLHEPFLLRGNWTYDRRGIGDVSDKDFSIAQVFPTPESSPFALTIGGMATLAICLRVHHVTRHRLFRFL